MNIFQKIKSEVDFLSAMEHYCGPLKQVGDDTYTTEADECPIHGGHGCFRMKVDGENSIVNCFGNCDHDDWPVDLIEFVRIKEGLETVGESARLIARDFNVKMPVETPVSRIYFAAFEYYRDLLTLGMNKLKVLGKRTPMEYQIDVRQHKRESIEAANVGWADGGLLEYLEDDFTKEELLSSGLVSEKNGKMFDTIPKDSFVYPHFWNGRVSRFTFKNTAGKVYQIKKQYWLNGIEFFAVGNGSPVAIVEGENDLIALLDNGWPGTVMCTNGSLSKSQIDWMCNNPTEYHTFWDGDEAGNNYADKMWKAQAAGRLPELKQWAVPEGSDIDSYLKGNALSDLTEMQQPDREDIINVTNKNKNNVIEEGGCYKVVAISKDGENEARIQISDFIVKLLYVKVQGDERSRVIRIIRNDGRRSKPITVNSEAKVSLRHWKILVANAVDASFVGSEIDLAAMWTYIYNSQREAVVDVPPYVGNMEDNNGWIFGNQYVGKGLDIEGDDDNIMWFDQKKTKGIAPKSLMASLSSTNTPGDIPVVWKGEETDEFIRDVCINLDKILKDKGIVLAIMGWMRSCAYSMPLFYDAKLKFFPFLLLWGRHGRGKSTLANWMLSMYDMADKGTTTVGQLRSGVGIERKLAYYRGLPYCIDELRADRQASEYSRAWRGWYNRSSRVKGTRNNEDIVQVPLNACLFFSGQDTFTDPAMRSRCIPCKFPPNAGDDEAYMWLEDSIENMPTIGYHWVREAMSSNIHAVKDGIQEYKEELKKVTPPGVSSRSIANYAMIGYFAKEMAEECFPEFDAMGWLAESMSEEQRESVEEDMVAHFWNGVAGLQIGDRPGISGNHIMVSNGKLYIWYAEVHKLVAGDNRGSDAREAFSKGAVKAALIEEPYYDRETTVRMGVTNTTRRCLVFTIGHPDTPQEFNAVVETANCMF